MGDKPRFSINKEGLMSVNSRMQESPLNSDNLKLRKVPELDFRSFLEGSPSQKTSFVESLYEGLVDYGFIILNNHPLKEKQIQDSYKQVVEFFSLPISEKEKYAALNGGQRGYTPFLKEHAKDSKYPDLKEFWHVGRELSDSHPYQKVYDANLWPAEIKDFKPVMLDLYKTLDEISKSLLEALGIALDLEPGVFSKMIQDGNSILRAIHYPPLQGNDITNSIRAAAHEDINLITMLVGATDSGLQLKDRDGTWLSVESTSNQIVVDSGDMLSRLTNDVIPATTHRVVNPDSENSSRFSMPFFVHPNPEAVLKCLPSCVGKGAKYPDILANDFLLQRLKEIGLLK